MPVSKELRCLTSSGGHGGRLKNDPNQWCFNFNNKTLKQKLLWNATPAETNGTENNNDSIESNDDETTVSPLEEDNIIEAYQNVAHQGTTITLKGNQLIDVKSLEDALDKAAVCKKCSKKNMNSLRLLSLTSARKSMKK